MGVYIQQLSSAEHYLQLRSCQSTGLPAAFFFFHRRVTRAQGCLQLFSSSITELLEHRVACSFFLLPSPRYQSTGLPAAFSSSIAELPEYRVACSFFLLPSPS